jgi:uncharacterized protein
MFGLSLAKLIVLVGIILVVWYAFKFAARVQEVREAEARRQTTHRRATPRGEERHASEEVEDMVKCRVCGAYVPVRGAGNCGQADCPYGR